MSTKKDKSIDPLSQEDKILFNEAMKDVKPIDLKSKHTANKSISLPQSTLKSRRELAQNTEANTHTFTDMWVESIAPEANLQYKQADLSNAVFAKFKSEYFMVEDVLDLHGYTIEKAMSSLWGFMHDSLERDYRYVRVIHGKSNRRFNNQEVTLKSLVVVWLARLPFVLAYCSCLPKSGGTGALNVLLKRQRKS